MPKCKYCQNNDWKINNATGVATCNVCGEKYIYDYVKPPEYLPEQKNSTAQNKDFNKIEYKVIRLQRLVTEKGLNKLGDNGWKLSSIVPINNMYVYYFSREILQTIYIDDGEIFELE